VQKFIFLITLSFISLIYLNSLVAAQDNQVAIQFDSTEQIFLDDYLIESTEYITRRINQIQKNPGGPVLIPEKPSLVGLFNN
jgi:hypothetical protein